MEMRKEDIKKALLIMSSKELKEIEEEAKETRLSNVENEIELVNDKYNKLISEFNIIKNDYSGLEEENKKFKEQLEVMQESTNKVTDTLLTHGKEKRSLDKHVSSLVYKELHKDSLRDEIFHGYLTSCCKKSICESLNVGAMQWIEIGDVDMAKTLAIKFLNKVTIHSLMRKYANKLNKEYELSKMDNKKESISLGKARKFELLELLIEEVGGDINEI
ncbi:UNVERIFIED_ORG: hypothetical protein B2H93_04985 [Clostridium botulinum]